MKKELNKRVVALSALLLALLVLLVLCGCSPSVVATGKSDGIAWTLDSDGTMTFSGSGTIPGAEYALNGETGESQDVYPDWFDHRGSVRAIVVENGVEHISMNAFLNFDGAISVDIAESVKTVEGYAFSGCTALEKFTTRGASTSLERYCVGYSSGGENDNLSSITFVGIAGSDVERYADSCGAHFRRL